MVLRALTPHEYRILEGELEDFDGQEIRFAALYPCGDTFVPLVEGR